MSRSAPNLLDGALGLGAARFVQVEDRAETSGAFVLHHLLKRTLSAPRAAVVLLAHPFSHYDRILRKLLTVIDKRARDGTEHFENKVHNFHFKVRENGVDYFYPGKNIKEYAQITQDGNMEFRARTWIFLYCMQF